MNPYQPPSFKCPMHSSHPKILYNCICKIAVCYINRNKNDYTLLLNNLIVNFQTWFPCCKSNFCLHLSK